MKGWGRGGGGGKLYRTGDVLCHICQTTTAKKLKGKSKHWEKEEKEKKKKERKIQKHTEKKKETPPHTYTGLDKTVFMVITHHTLDLTRQCSW